ncbi:hypothetical protein DRP04_12775 [Archaeoglobales archaeon]|nr:MAG: hypothetical protein DRP04_12775 [Archaeoglobales archaeon]
MDTAVIEELSKMLSDKKVVSAEELGRKAIRAILRTLKDKAADVNDGLIRDVVYSFIECPLSLKSLHFSEEVKIGDIKFYHLHTQKPEKEDFDEAYREYVISKSYLSKLEVMKDVTDRFFSEYNLENDGILRIYSNNRYRYGVFYSRIEDVYEDVDHHIETSISFDGEYVVVVPTEDRVHPFIKFFRNHSEKVRRADMKIWVVNTESKTIDPFIGYPKDFLLLKGFKNPKIASLISSLWRVEVEDLD